MRKIRQRNQKRQEEGEQMSAEDIKNRLVLDSDSIYSGVEEILEEIKNLRGDRYFVKTLGDNTVRKIKEYDTLIKKRMRDAFSLVVIGDFKRGKSTLINAILGSDVVPAAVTPETVTVNRISYAEEPKAEAVLTDGKRYLLGMSELKREAVERLAKQLPSQIDYIDIKSDNEILKDISIVDTPGIGDLMNAFNERVAEYLLNADAVVYVISARSPLSLSEQAFLSSAVIPQSFSRVIAVVNMADTLETAENIERVKTLTTERVRSIGSNFYVYALSALDELCRKKGLKRPEPCLEKYLEDGFMEFENALNRDLILQKDIIKSMRAVELTVVMLKDISARAGLVKTSLKNSAEKKNADIGGFEQQDGLLKAEIEKKLLILSGDIDEMKNEAKTWLSDYMDRLKNEIEEMEKTADTGDLERHFQFYMTDSVKNAVTAVVERHQKDIEDKISSAVRELAGEVSQAAFGSVDARISDCIADISWTGVDTAMFTFELADSVFGISNYLGPLYLVGQAVAGFVRQKAVGKRQRDFLEPILREFRSVSDEVKESTAEIYERLKIGAADRLNEMYRRQVEASSEAIEQAKNIMRDENVKAEEVIGYIDNILSELERCREKLEVFY